MRALKIRTQNPSALRHNELGARGPVPLCGQRLFLLASYFLTCTNEDFRLVMVPTLDLAGLTGMAILLAELLLAPRGSVPSTPPLPQCCSARNHTIGEFVLDYMGLLYNRSTPRAFSSIPHHPPHHTHIYTTTTSFSLFDRFLNRQSLQVTNSNFFASQPALLFANSLYHLNPTTVHCRHGPWRIQLSSTLHRRASLRRNHHLIAEQSVSLVISLNLYFPFLFPNFYSTTSQNGSRWIQLKRLDFASFPKAIQLSTTRKQPQHPKLFIFFTPISHPTHHIHGQGRLQRSLLAERTRRLQLNHPSIPLQPSESSARFGLTHQNGLPSLFLFQIRHTSASDITSERTSQNQILDPLDLRHLLREVKTGAPKSAF